MQVLKEPAGTEASPSGSLESVLSDLAEIFANDGVPYMCLGPKEALLSVKTPDLVFAFGEHVPARRWIVASPRQKAELVLSWISKAAEYYRNPRIRFAPPQGQSA